MQKNKTQKQFKKIFLPILLAVFGLGVFAFSSEVQAAEDLKAENVTRIMPPAYYYSNQYYSGAWGYPWNYDGTKIILYEVTSASLAHPVYGTRGRGWVWANVQDMVNACTNNSCMNNPSQTQLNQWVEDYLNVTHDIPDIEPTGIPQYYPVFSLTHQTAIRWSKTSDIIYFIDKKGSSYFNVKSYNIDTGAVVQVFQLPAQSTWNGGNKTPIIFGDFFNGSKLLISTLDPANDSKESWLVDPTMDGYVVDVASPANSYALDNAPKTDCGAMSDMEWSWPSWTNHGHGDISPGRTMKAEHYGAGVGDSSVGVKIKGDCLTNFDLNPNGMVHVDWPSSDNWYFTGRGRYFSKAHPHIEDKMLEQIIFDPVAKTYTHNVLYHPMSAGSWGTGYSNSDVMPYVVGRSDGKQALFGGSAGLYTVNDKNNYPSGPPGGGSWQLDVNYGYATAYIMNVIPTEPNPADVNSDNSVNIKDIQICIREIITPTGNMRADVNGDTHVNIKDIREIIRKIINP